MEHRQYQTDLENEIIQTLWHKKRIVAQAGTGAGKSKMFAAITKRFITKFPKAKIVIAVHREELAEQTQKTLSHFHIVCGMLMAGEKMPTNNVIVAMVETLNKRIIPFIDLLILDEVHIGNFTKIIDKADENCLIIGFTATPVSRKRDPLINYFSDIVIGPPIKTLIAEGYLSQPRLITKGGIIKKELKIKNGEYTDASQFEQYGNKKQLSNTLDAYRKFCEHSKTVIFNCNVEHSMLITAKFKEAGYNIRHLDGTTPKPERKDIITWFNITPDAILSNVQVATTGFDCPTTESIILNFSTKSLAKKIQCEGRGSRRINGVKEKFTIVDLGENYLEHGLWEDEPDWKEMFFNPGKPSNGVAPVKSCPECEAMLHTSVTLCPFCGCDMPKVQRYDNTKMEFKEIAFNPGQSLNIEAQISRSIFKGRHIWSAMYAVIQSAAKKANHKSNTPQLALSYLDKQASIFYKTICKPYTKDSQKFIRQKFYEELVAIAKK